jgi:hypothetical protein
MDIEIYVSDNDMEIHTGWHSYTHKESGLLVTVQRGMRHGVTLRWLLPAVSLCLTSRNSESEMSSLLHYPTLLTK